MTTDPGAGQRDQSVQFSLKELMKLETDRIAEEQREREAREVAAVKERAEEEDRRRAEAEARDRDQAETDARRRRAEGEEQARREAMQKAIVEQARVEVEARAHGEERDRARRHEIELEKLRAPAAKAPSPLLTGVCGAAAMLLLALGAHFAVVKPAADHRLADRMRSGAAAEERAEEADRRLLEQRGTIEGLEKASKEAQGEIANLKKELLAQKKAPAPAPPSRPPTARPAPTAPAVPCRKGDPLCFTVESTP